MSTRPTRHLLPGPDFDLRPIIEQDGPAIVAWRNDPDNARAFFASGRLTLDMHQQWFARYLADGDDWTMAIVPTGEAAPVGMLGVFHVDFAARRAEFGRMLMGDRRWRGRGLATAASRRLMAAARDLLGLDQLYLDVVADNAPAIGLYEGLGFRTVRVDPPRPDRPASCEMICDLFAVSPPGSAPLGGARKP